jgi:hypothetical protein
VRCAAGASSSDAATQTASPRSPDPWDQPCPRILPISAVGPLDLAVQMRRPERDRPKLDRPIHQPLLNRLSQELAPASGQTVRATAVLHQACLAIRLVAAPPFAQGSPGDAAAATDKASSAGLHTARPTRDASSANPSSSSALRLDLMDSAPALPTGPQLQQDQHRISEVNLTIRTLKRCHRTSHCLL